MSHLKHILRDIEVSVVGVQTDPSVCRTKSPEYVFALHPHRRRVPTFLRRLQQNRRYCHQQQQPQRLSQLNTPALVRTNSAGSALLVSSFDSLSSSSCRLSSSSEGSVAMDVNGGLMNGMLCREERVSACSCTNPRHEHVALPSMRVSATFSFPSDQNAPPQMQAEQQQPSYHQVHRTYSETRRFYKNLLRFTNCTDKLACECMLGSCPFWTLYLLLQTINFPRKRLFNAQTNSVFQERIRSMNVFIGLVIHKLRVCREEHMRLQQMNVENGVTKPCKVLLEIEQFLALNSKVVRTFIDAENRACFKLNLKGWQSDWKNLYVVETNHETDQDRDQDVQQSDAQPVPVPDPSCHELPQEFYSPQHQSQRVASKSPVGVFYLEDDADCDCICRHSSSSCLNPEEYELFHLESSMASTILEDEELPVTPEECEIAL